MGSVELIVILAMIAFNSVFAAYEIALAAVSAARLQVLVREDGHGARAALYMKENVEASLAAIQLGITLFGAVAAATGGAGAEERFAPWFQQRFRLPPSWAELLAVTAVVLPLTAVTIMFGELVPKVFALRNKELVCLTLSPAMRWFTFSVWPAVWLFETGVSAVADWGQRRFCQVHGEAAELQELRAVTSLARTLRLIGHQEEEIIHSAARLSSRPIKEIMLPAASISMLDVNGSLADGLVAAHLDMHTRFPVTERARDPQQIIGYVNIKDIVAVMRLSPQELSLRAVIRPLLSFQETDSIAACLERLLRENAHIALVRNGEGRIAGMVTLEDIVEELLGDIGDEYDRPPAYATPSGPAWVVGGGIGLARLHETTGIDLAKDMPPVRAEILSEWVAGHLGRPVRGGDVIERDDVRVIVRKVRRQQVLEAQVGRVQRC